MLPIAAGISTAERELEAATGKIGVIDDSHFQALGAGFCISSTGTVLTAGHLVQIDREYAIKFKNSEPLPIKIVKAVYDPATGDDYAVATISEQTDLAYAALRKVDYCLGQTIQKGYPVNFNEQTSAQGCFLGVIDVDETERKRLFHFRSEEAGAAGFSGSAVYSVEKGGVVAIQTEAADNVVGPLSTSVLAFPIARIPRELLKVPFATEWRWWYRTRLRELSANSLRAMITVTSAAVLLAIGLVTTNKIASLNKQLEAFGDERFLELNTKETLLWLSDDGRSFKSQHNPQNGTWNDSIYRFLETHPPMLSDIVELAGIYDRAASCFVGSLCFDYKVCSNLYPQIWNFYHAYLGVWNEFNKTTGNKIDRNMENFLKSNCEEQRQDYCRSTDSRLCKV